MSSGWHPEMCLVTSLHLVFSVAPQHLLWLLGEFLIPPPRGSLREAKPPFLLVEHSPSQKQNSLPSPRYSSPFQANTWPPDRSCRETPFMRRERSYPRCLTVIWRPSLNFGNQRKMHFNWVQDQTFAMQANLMNPLVNERP